MRTEYALWKHEPDKLGEKAGQYPTEQEAMDAAPVADWQPAPAGGMMAGRWVTGNKSDIGWSTSAVRVSESDADRITIAIDLAIDGGGTEGEHHKQWALDRIVRVLAGDRYAALIAEYCTGEDGPDTYTWDEGIAP